MVRRSAQFSSGPYRSQRLTHLLSRIYGIPRHIERYCFIMRKVKKKNRREFSNSYCVRAFIVSPVPSDAKGFPAYYESCFIPPVYATKPAAVAATSRIGDSILFFTSRNKNILQSRAVFFLVRQSLLQPYFARTPITLVIPNQTFEHVPAIAPRNVETLYDNFDIISRGSVANVISETYCKCVKALKKGIKERQSAGVLLRK